MKKLVSLAILAFAVFTTNPCTADSVFFGDSLSDSGNLFNLTGNPPPPYFNGRLSNGPTWAEIYAAQVGDAAVASTSGGTNYAFAGARTGPTSPPFNLVDQVDSFVAGSTATPDDTFFIWAGSNDVFDAAGAGDPAAVIAAAIANISSSIQTLHANGAEDLLVLNAAPQGETPFYRALGAPTVAFLNSLSQAFNASLAAEVQSLELSLGIQIQEIDMYAFFLDVQADPSAYGLINVVDSVTPFDPGSALSTGGPTGNPAEYLFWDGIHPTAAGHQLVADHVYAQRIPEPASLTLLVAFGTIAFSRRRKSA
ncbi:MAG: SGNH/GDSL hydrolase family protein [Planctomycetota bacterium]